MKTFLYKIYLYSFLDEFMLVYPIYAVLFKESGLSTFQISTLFAVWAFTSLILEIPTGILADKFSRKNILIIAQIIRIFGYTSWLFFHTYIGFLAGFILWAINGAMKSGTFEALVYDEMKSMEVERDYEKILSRLKIFSFLGLSMALALGGFVAKINFEVPIIISIITLCIGTVNLITYKKVEIINSTKETHYLKFLRNALAESWNNKILFELIILFASIFGIYGAFDEYLSVIFKDKLIAFNLIGILLAGNYILYGIGIALAGYIKLRSNLILFSMALLSGSLIFISGMVGDINLLAAFVLISAVFLGFMEVKIVAGVQKLIDSNARATIISLKVFLQEVIVIFYTLLIGYVADIKGMNSILILSGMLILAIAILFTFSHLVFTFGQNTNNSV